MLINLDRHHYSRSHLVSRVLSRQRGPAHPPRRPQVQRLHVARARPDHWQSALPGPHPPERGRDLRRPHRVRLLRQRPRDYCTCSIMRSLHSPSNSCRLPTHLSFVISLTQSLLPMPFALVTAAFGRWDVLQLLLNSHTGTNVVDISSSADDKYVLCHQKTLV